MASPFLSSNKDKVGQCKDRAFVQNSWLKMHQNDELTVHVGNFDIIYKDQALCGKGK